MRRFVLLAVTVGSLLPAGGCVAYCSDSRGRAFGRNMVPFARRTVLCNGNHCYDRAGNHLDVRCNCSKACECWGDDTAKLAVGDAPDNTAGAPAGDPSGGCGCGA